MTENDSIFNNSVRIGINGARDVVVIVLAASREGENGERLPITDGQKETAMNAAKSVLQCVGADVVADSTAWVIPSMEQADDENVVVDVSASVSKVIMEE